MCVSWSTRSLSPRLVCKRRGQITSTICTQSYIKKKKKKSFLRKLAPEISGKFIVLIKRLFVFSSPFSFYQKLTCSSEENKTEDVVYIFPVMKKMSRGFYFRISSAVVGGKKKQDLKFGCGARINCWKKKNGGLKY